MIYGYARVSTKKQNIDRQIRNIITAYPDTADNIFAETYTGTKIDRPQWKRLHNKLKTGDTVVFDEVSRMSRNADEGIKLYFELFDAGVELIFLKEPHINTSTYMTAIQNQVEKVGDDIADIYITATNKVLKIIAEKQIKIAFQQAQKEVDYLHKRTREGLETAKVNGKQVGRKCGDKLIVKKEKNAKEIIVKHSKEFGGNLNDCECAKVCGISRTTFYKYKKELQEK